MKEKAKYNMQKAYDIYCVCYGKDSMKALEL